MPHCTQLHRDTHPVNKDCLYLGQHLKGAACGDDKVGILACLQRADAVGHADMLRRVEGDGLQRIERVHARLDGHTGAERQILLRND